MKYIFFVLLFISLIFNSCNEKQKLDLENHPHSHKNDTVKTLSGVYRYYWGEKEGFKIWIVDGSIIRRAIFNEFVYGGNPERYTFIPDSEIWIDNSISSEEFETTLAHELNERNLMAKCAMSYYDAHDSSLAVELQMRRGFLKRSAEHESKLNKITPIDFDSTQEITDIPSLIRIKNIYRVPEGERNGIRIWIVDGFAVRREIYPDFGFSGNDKAYRFIPEGEIWIDGSVSCEETEFSIAQELKEREMMISGKSYDDAYTEAVKVSDTMRVAMQKLINERRPVQINYPLYRDTGTGKERK
jgi:hypothetical protein